MNRRYFLKLFPSISILPSVIGKEKGILPERAKLPDELPEMEAPFFSLIHNDDMVDALSYAWNTPAKIHIRNIEKQIEEFKTPYGDIKLIKHPIFLEK